MKDRGSKERRSDECGKILDILIWEDIVSWFDLRG